MKNQFPPISSGSTKAISIKDFLENQGIFLPDDEITKIVELGVATPEDLAMLEKEDFLLIGIKTVTYRKILSAAEQLKKCDTKIVKLPEVISEELWTTALVDGAILKVSKETATSLARVVAADSAGLFSVPVVLQESILKYAEAINEPVSPKYSELRNFLTTKEYGYIFSAIPGFSVDAISKRRISELKNKIHTQVIPAAFNVKEALENWYAIFANDPTLVAQAVSKQSDGLMSCIPDVGTIRDACESLMDAINKTLSGVGAQAATVLALDAGKIVTILQDPELPKQVGAPNKDIMLKQLGIGIAKDIVRLEKDFTQFLLSILNEDIPTDASAEKEYFMELRRLSARIPWNVLMSAHQADNVGVSSETLQDDDDDGA